MKKFLALVLALVMTMSLVTISAGAEGFTDDSKITYEEAVDVVSAAGIVGGYADGSFNPTGTLTRGAAAKIICNMILGPTTAEALSADAAPFKDVPADHVFAGYIAYCVNEGIISGYADGTFRPAATLTGYAFMKMLLGALGYDASIENYTGSNWSIQVAKRALNVGLNKGLEGTFVGTKALTREEACLYAFNTLKAVMVEYDSKSSISVGDIVISQNSDAKEQDLSDTSKAAIIKDGKLNFCEKFFPDLSLKSSDADKFGRPAHTWKYDKETVGTYTDDAVLAYNDEVKVGDLKDDLYDLDVELLDEDPDTKDKDDTSVTVITNGKKQAVSYDEVASYKNSEKLGGAGIAIELYDEDDDDVIDTIVVVTTYAAKVTKVVKDKASTKADESALVLEVVNTGDKIEANEDETTGFADVYGEVEKGDYVLVTPENDNTSADYALTIEIPEVVEGIVTKTATDTKVSIDGEVYAIAKLATKVQSLVANSKAERTIYLDTYGNAIYTPDSVADSADLVYVTKVFTEEDRYGTGTHWAQVVHTDGTTEEIELETAQELENVICSYEIEDNDDAYTLTKVEFAANDVIAMGGKTIKASDAKIDGTSTGNYYYSDDVVFVYVNKTGAKLSVTVKEGVQKINTVPANSYAILNSDNDVICVFVRSGASNAINASDLAYIVDVDYDGTALDDDGKRQNTYKFYVNGEEYVEIAETDGIGFMNYSVDGVTYKFEKVTESDGAYINIDDAVIGKNKYVTVSDKEIEDATLAEDCEVYNLDSDYEIDDLADIAELQGEDYNKTVTISFMYDKDDNVITSLYVIEVK